MARSAVSAIVIVAVCLLAGGWPWALISILALLSLERFEAETVLAASFASLIWLVLYSATGDRRLFFPFTMQFAIQAGFTRRIRGAAVVITFLLIRIAQGGTMKVLLVELVVAAVVVALCLAACGFTSRDLRARVACAAAGSFLAFLGLAL